MLNMCDQSSFRREELALLAWGSELSFQAGLFQSIPSKEKEPLLGHYGNIEGQIAMPL